MNNEYTLIALMAQAILISSFFAYSIVLFTREPAFAKVHLGAGRWRAIPAHILIALALPMTGAEASSSVDREPPVILVPPIPAARDTEPLQLTARVQDVSGVRSVSAWAKGEREESYHAFPMSPAGDDTFAAEIPVSPGRGEWVSYYVEATDRLGNGPRRSGDPTSPFIARLQPGPHGAPWPAIGTRPALPGASVLGVGLLTLLWFLWKRRRPAAAPPFHEAGRVAPAPAPQEQQDEQDRFWFGLLSPLLQLSPDEASAEIVRLARCAPRNPVNGQRMYDGGMLMQRLEWARQADRRKSVRAAPRPLAPRSVVGATAGGPSNAERDATRAGGRSSAGMTMIEALVVLALFGIALGMAGLYLRPMEAPLRTGAELVDAFFRQVRARSMATTSAHRVLPATDHSLSVERAASCSAGAWTPVPGFALELPREVTMEDTAWSVCFSSRGLASNNIVVALDHPQLGSQRLEVLRGGSVRWLQ